MTSRPCNALLVCAALSVLYPLPAGSREQTRDLPENRKIIHALNRLTFGPAPGDIERVGAMGLKRWIDRQLHPEKIRESPVLEEKLHSFDSLAASTREMGNAMDRGVRQRIAQSLMAVKLYRAIYSERQLQEVLTDFWYNHFNIFLNKGADRVMVTAYERDVIRPHVLGKFEDLLVATAKSPAMLFYLDNWQSAAPNPTSNVRPGRARRGINENYARELMELHTLGVDGGYTQKDVTEVARCFTGWTIREPRRGGAFEFNGRMHDRGEKVVLGVKIPAGGGIEDGMKVLHILAHHPSTAKFLSEKLAQRFVSDAPPASLVQKMASTFQRKNGDLRAVLNTMLGSREFWSEAAWRAKMKSPLEMTVSAIRALGADVDSTAALSSHMARMGQPLYRKQEPTGYSNLGREWVSSAGLLARMKFALALVSNQVPGVHVDGNRFGAEEDPSQIARALLAFDPGAGDLGAIQKELSAETVQSRAPRSLLVAGLMLGSPEFQRR